MARALSQDLRDRVVAAIDEGLSCRAAAARFGIGVATAVRWRQLALRHGRAVAGKPSGDRRSAKMDQHAEFILGLMAERGDITLAEMQIAMEERGSAVGWARCGASSTAAASRVKKDGARDRAGPLRCPEPQAQLVRRAADLEPERLVFIDETWTTTNTTRR